MEHFLDLLGNSFGLSYEWIKLTYHMYFFRSSILYYNPDMNIWEETDFMLPNPDLVHVAFTVPSDYLDCEF